MEGTSGPVQETAVKVPINSLILDGNLAIPMDARGIVVFAHGSGSGRHSPRNRFVAQALREAGLGTLLMDLLTMHEEEIDAMTAEYRFDIALLAGRLIGATNWLASQPRTRDLQVGYFGASTGAAAALVAAARKPDEIFAVVSRGGRPDLADPALGSVKAPTLLIIGGNDFAVIEMNQQAYVKLHAEKSIQVIPGATHLFEEPGALEEVARMARDWFAAHLAVAARESRT